MRSHCVLVRGGPQRSRSAVRFSERLAITSSCSETLFTKIIRTLSSSKIRKGRFLSGWKRLSWFHQKKVWINTSFHTYRSMFSSNDSLKTTERIPLSRSLPLPASSVFLAIIYKPPTSSSPTLLFQEHALQYFLQTVIGKLFLNNLSP